MSSRSSRNKSPSWLVVAGVAAFLLVALGLWLFSPDDSTTGQNREPEQTSQGQTSPAESAPPTQASEPTEVEPTEVEPTEVDSVDAPEGNGGVDPDSGLRWVAEADLPPEAWDTLQLIDDGGPYPYDEDDGTFGNFEGVLPDRERGYYREYTVETPGLSHRGALRIVTGSRGEFYWTEDHYESFERIDRGTAGSGRR